MKSSKTQRNKSSRSSVRKNGPAQRKLGKVGVQTKFDQINTAGLIADIARGIPVEIACTATGIHRDTFYHWLDNRPAFAQALAAEKQRVILEALDAIKGCSTKDREFRQWTWFLETVYRDYFAPPDKGPLFAQNVFTISFEKAREIEQMRTELLPEVQARLGIGQTNGSKAVTEDGQHG
jgi:hypothetical protein